MPDPNPVEPTIAERAQRVHRSVFDRVANTPRVSGAGVPEEVLVEEAQRELESLRAVHSTTVEQLAAQHQREIEKLRGQHDAEVAAVIAAQAAKCASELAAARSACEQRCSERIARAADAHKLEVAALTAALTEARAKAIYAGPETGDVETWSKRLAAMPTPASGEILTWSQSALRRLAVIGATQMDVIIVRLALILLKPYTEAPNANAETT